jgi:ketosteroid isomerase-like protein
MSSDAAVLLQAIYRAYREKRLTDVLAYFDENFRFVAHVPDEALPGGDRPRDKAETGQLFRQFMDDYEFLEFEHGPIIVTGDRATVHAEIRIRHKATGKLLETKLTHTWRVGGGKALELEERHDVPKLLAYLKTIANGHA